MKTINLFLVLILLFSCSKNKVNNRRLPGSWTIDMVRIEDGEGFLFYDYVPSGWFLIDGSLINGKANYTYSYFGQYWVSDSVNFNQAQCSLSADGEVLSIARLTDTLQAKIIMLTKHQLTFEYYDYLQYRLKRFSCSR